MSEGYVLDTNALLFYAGDQLQKLGPKAKRAFTAFEQGRGYLMVPAPVVMETWLLAQGGRLRFPTTLDAWWADIARPELVHEPMSEADVREAARLDWEHRAPFDRLIVAVARRLGLPLLTRDSAITDWAQSTGGIEVAW
ncbi:type II toxin-antitoxin system VapC family toxin [Corallococcus sp. BB11-1]|uniref:type II toxin-antitoxin system VapC family toxin n=1 Tax=Corallococcus sp. BB11-1 TaxID=2996783 RepID=UPI002271805F|nr:type II toxin-antitoxin system VapC family toxin [Corallococcus sp. BB11-1]MCY1031863.1 type II toxin-antitoxin system VapC family toxin [Corallococcus sp. BB11-1]